MTKALIGKQRQEVIYYFNLALIFLSYLIRQGVLERSKKSEEKNNNNFAGCFCYGR